MKRLNIITEGASEEIFVRQVLYHHLITKDIFVSARSVHTSKTQRGGISSYLKAKNEIEWWIKEEARDNVYFSTMFDFYKIPSDFPKFDDAQKKNLPYDKLIILEDGLKDDVSFKNFIPYIQLHEFETLILTSPHTLLSSYIEFEKEVKELEDLLDRHNGNAELINGGVDTHPFKQIKKRITPYTKRNGAELTSLIGIETLKQKCPHLKEWIERLETI